MLKIMENSQKYYLKNKGNKKISKFIKIIIN